MAGPSPSWQAVSIYATWENFDGTKKPGTWNVTIPVRVTNATDDVIFPAGKLFPTDQALSTSSGLTSLRFDCPATDDPDNSPQGWQVTVTVNFADKSQQEVYVIPVPLASQSTGINLRLVTLPQTIPDPQPVLIKGIPGGIAGLDVDGDVVDADGTKILAGGGGGGGPITADDITDATTVGKASIRAANQAAGRSAIGAGTSNLALGSTGSTAAPGNDARLSDTRTPTDGTVTNAKVSASAAIAGSKIALDTDATMAANSDTVIPSQKAVKSRMDSLISANDAMVFKGVIDCSTNPNYPAADRGWTYRVSVAGKIGGASGATVGAGDLLLCLDDGTPSGTQAAQGSHWNISPSNVSGAVIGPTSAVNNNFPQFDLTTGKLIKDSGTSPSSFVAAGDAALTDARNGKAPNWAATTAYKANQLVVNTALLYQAKVDFTSGASFNPSDWNAVGGAAQGTIVSTDISDSTAVGRAVLTAADAAAARTQLGLGTAATHATTDYDAAGAAAAVQAGLGTIASHAATEYLLANDASVTNARPAVLKAFVASRAYLANEAIRQAGNIYSAKVAFTSGASFNVADWNLAADTGGGGGAITNPRPAFLTVASSQLPSQAAGTFDYVCDGTDDQIEINAALLRASRPGDGFGGEGWTGVELVGPRLLTAHNATGPGTGAITMYPSTMLKGAGFGTVITPNWAVHDATRGCIELVNGDASHISIKDLTVAPINAALVNGSGIRINANPTGQAYEIKTSNDPYNRIQGVAVMFMRGHNYWITGSGSGSARESQMIDCISHTPGGNGFWIDGSSDNQLLNCRSFGGGGVGFASFNLGGGNTKIADSKCYYSDADGYLITSSRCEVSDCSAQDNGRYGFNLSGGDLICTGLQADSNMRLDQTGAGYRIASAGIFEGLGATDRNQTPGSRQTKSFELVGNPQGVLTGRSNFNGFAGVPITAGVAITGAMASGSFARVVRVGGSDGATMYSVG